MRSISGSKSKAKAGGAAKKDQRTHTIKVCAGAGPLSVEAQAYNQLCQATNIRTSLELGYLQEEGNGLLTSQKKGKHEVQSHAQLDASVLVLREPCGMV